MRVLEIVVSSTGSFAYMTTGLNVEWVDATGATA